MKILTIPITIDGTNGEYRVDVYGDTHFATKGVDAQRLKKDIQETKKSGRAWVHAGDVIDGILPGERRWNVMYTDALCDWAWNSHQKGNLIEAEWREFKRQFMPIARQCITVCAGDGKHNEFRDVADPFKNSLEEMGIKDGGYIGYVLDFRFKRGESTSIKSMRVMLHHSRIAGSKENKMRHMRRVLQNFHNIDAFICGHGHDKVQTRIDNLDIVRGGEIQVIRRAAMTGSYLRTYTKNIQGYGEMALFDPIALGRISLVLRPFCNDPEKRVEFENM